jgi:Zn-dependent protease with chaperone function
MSLSFAAAVEARRSFGGRFLQKHSHMKSKPVAGSIIVLLFAALLTAQTTVTPPDNKYSPAEDAELGRKAAAEARRQLPIMRDDRVSSYVENLGDRLVDEVSADLRHREFRYSFDVVNVRDINAFALPGGPMFVNRGMIEAAGTEGEVAGVMAHELSHVVLRHGTAQASNATKYQIGQVLGGLLGAVIGGTVGNVVAQGTQFGLGAAFLRFGREYERQADILGAQMMARAGYDPRDMANMFKTIERQSGSGGPEWLSDHPNPGNRSEYITREAQALTVQNPVRDTQAFSQVKNHLRSLPKAPTAEQAARSGRRTGTVSPGRVDPPSTRLVEYNEGNLFRVSVPSNWRELAGSSAVTFAPEGAYGNVDGRSLFTHGVEIGMARNETHDLRTATDELIASLAETNPRLGRAGGYSRGSIDGRSALQATLRNVSDAAGQREVIQLVTTRLRDGTLLYVVAVAPENEFDVYQPTFRRVIGSIRLMEK